MGSEKSGGVGCDVGLGLNMKKIGGFGGGGSGPFYFSGNKQVVCMGDVYDVVGVGSSDGSVSSSLHNHFNNDTFKSSFSGVSLRLPFTSLQLQELERQSIIYKYMMASIPIPSELLPSSSSLADHHHHNSAAVLPANTSTRLWDMGCTSNGGSHPEPWRCRRTDGKKWRCSRDVAPDQKYCERHTHKNKPRSRKPVEVHQSHSSSVATAATTTGAGNKTTRNAKPPPPPPQYFNQMEHHHPYPSSSYANISANTPFDQSRYSDWLVKGENNSVDTSNHQWQPLMHSSLGLKRDSTNFAYQQHQLEDQSMNVNDQCSLFLGPKLVSLEGALNLEQSETPRDFMNAWSIAERDDPSNIKCSVSSHGKMPLSSLTLSMPGENRITNGDDDEEEDDESMGGLNLNSSSLLNWMNPGSWMGSGSTQPGGPLAEALCLGMASSAKSGSNPESPRGDGESSGGKGSHGFNLM